MVAADESAPWPALGDRYRIIDTIAAGGMGTVYLARLTEQNGTPAAIKVLHPHLAKDPNVVAMFVDEARVATRIHHPNVVTVSDVDLVGGDLVIAMEYVEGAPLHWLLRDLHARGDSLPLAASVQIVCDALDGLHAAHELTDGAGTSLGLVHRDVSPQNILVGVDGVARVTDFGVAMTVGRISKTAPDAPVKGKLQYLAPEQIKRREDLDRRVDVFAAGIVLWECLTGRTLFGGGTEAEAIARVLREPIDPPSAHRMEISPALDDVCLRALERDPSRRFASTAELARALRAATTDLTIGREELGALVMDVCGEPIRKRREALLASVGDEPPASQRGTKQAGAHVTVSRTRVRAVGMAVALLGVAVIGLSVALFRAKPADVTLELVEVPAQASAGTSAPDPATATAVAAAAPTEETTPAGDAGAQVAPAARRHPGKGGKSLFMPGHL